MGVFDDNPFVKVVKGHAAADTAPKAGEIARGSYWSLLQEGSGFVLEYVSGSLEGKEKRLPVTDQEAARLRSGDDAVAEQVIVAHGAW